MESFVHKKKNFEFITLLDSEPVKSNEFLGWVKFGTLSYIFRDHALPISLKRQVFDQCIIPVLLC